MRNSHKLPHDVCRKLKHIFVNGEFDIVIFRSFYFDFSTTYVGAGMICSHRVNLSLLLGAVLSYGVMWPLISQLKGQWFPESLEESDMKSLYGYKVSLFICFPIPSLLFPFPGNKQLPTYRYAFNFLAGFSVCISNPW